VIAPTCGSRPSLGVDGGSVDGVDSGEKDLDAARATLYFNHLYRAHKDVPVVRVVDERQRCKQVSVARIG
jgi:hypothetical protein